jgi:adenosylmethionine-8-amino-7-oxononanoate aminotransferase
MSDWVERDAARVWHGFTQMSVYGESRPVVVERGEGHELIDTEGRRYLDAVSSLWVSTLGHRVPELDQALVDQLGRIAHSTMLGNGNVATIELAEALAPLVPVDDPRFLFASDGASAVEQALRIAFQYWANEGVSGKTRFLALGEAYHGDTFGALSVGDAGFYGELFAPLRFPVLRAPGYATPGWADATIALVAEHAHELAALVIEPLVQGAAGMRTAEPGDVRRVGEACVAHDVLLICDEVAVGFGRTGTLFASERCGLRPDILVLGKGLTAGYLAMSATVASGRVADAFLGADLGPETLYHGHSFGGNALAAAVARRHLELLEERNVLAHVRAREGELRALLERELAPLTGVREIRLCGLLGALELDTTEDELLARRVTAATVERGVFVRPIGPSILIVPPLTITTPELERIVAALRAAILETAPVGAQA